MKILIAEDDPISRTVLERMLLTWNYEVMVTCDGLSAWQVLAREDAPRLAILDWMMPGLDGAEVCQRLRDLERVEPTYLILLTAKDQRSDVVAGLESGANDYIVKPFNRSELRARIRVGERVVRLQSDLALRVKELEQALGEVKRLQRLLPICSYCKKVRDDQNYWQAVESYLSAKTDVQFSHGICPDCFRQAASELRRSGITIE